MVVQPEEVKKVDETHATPTGQPTVGSDSSLAEKWEENDYVVNVIYEK